jgi:membrane dipeptidase
MFNDPHPHADILAIDSHVDIPWPTGPSPFIDGPRSVDLPKLRAGGIAGVCFVAYVPQGARSEAGHLAALTRAREMLDSIAAMAATEGSGAVVASTAEAIEAAYAAGQTALIPVIENGYVLGRDVSLLDEFAARGVRYITLMHNGHNEIGDAAIPRRDLGDVESEHNGLSPFGIEVVKRMNALGILVDISHSSRTAMLQAAALSRAPLVATHSCMKTLCDHPRNLDDEQLEVLRETGGVVQVTMVSNFLRPRARGQDLSTVDIADHIDYAVQKIGIDHVGIGTDFDGGGGVKDFHNAAQAPRMTAELVRRGFRHEDIQKIWGGNFLRVLRQAEALKT